MKYQLAQANGSSAAAIAYASPGFVWRYLTDSRDPAQREFPDPLVLFNMSVWESGRRRWFVDTKAGVGGHAIAMWWISAGERPSVAEAKQRLDDITANGVSERAFTFKQRFAPPC
ncbi:MAG: DUF3291 domain-containing protein [Myxococcota bacterium]|nr:DUF3291 domain-containing protein [Myxococcota bacterium]